MNNGLHAKQSVTRLRGSVSGIAVMLLLGAITIAPVKAQVAISKNQGPALTSNTQSEGLEAIFVTARKTKENLQTVPIAVTAFSQAAMAERNFQNISDLAAATPDLMFNPVGRTGTQNAALFIRGVGQADSSPLSDPGVGVYVNGVYLPRNVGNIIMLGDFENVEVLRGPQGTLFGKNTIGGALNITLNAPVDHFDASAEFTVGSYNQYVAKVMVNAPLSDKLFLRVSAVKNTQDGYISLANYPGRSLGDNHVILGRAQLRWVAADNVTVDLSVDGSETNNSGTPEIARALYPNGLIGVLYNGIYSGQAACLTAAGQATDTRCFGPVQLPKNPHVSNEVFFDSTGHKVDPKSYDRQIGTNLVINWDLPSFHAKSISSYRSQRDVGRQNLGSVPFLFFEGNKNPDTSKQLTQELQLSGKLLSDSLRWLIGGYYSNEKITSLNEALGPIAALLPFASYPIYSISDFSAKTTNYAAFGQTTFSPVNWLHLTVGGRFTKEIKTASVLIAPSSYPRLNGRLSIHKFTPMASIAGELTKDILVYGSYAEGFRSGGFPARLAGSLSAIPTFGPESVKTYETGLKSELFEHRVRANIALFTSRYDNIQQSGTNNSIVPPAPSVINAGTATLRGIEGEVTAKINQAISIDGSVSYLDSYLTAINPTANDGGTPITLSKKLVYAPSYKASLGATLSHEFSDQSEVALRVDGNYTSKVWFSIGNQPLANQGSIVLINSSISYKFPNSHLEIAAGLRNITNKLYYTFGMDSAPVQSIALSTIAPPRTGYMTVRWHY